MRKIDILFADLFFIFHCLFGVFLLVGWFFPRIKFIYLTALILWLSSWLILGYCPLTKWEFMLRRKYNKDINPNDEAIQYYMKKFFNKNISAKAIFTVGLIAFIIFTGLTLIIN